MAKDKGKAKALVPPMRGQRKHGKDSKLVELVWEADKNSTTLEMEAAFDIKKIGKKAIFRPILASPFNARWPPIAPVLQDVILYSLLQLLQSAEAQKYLMRENQAIPRTSARKTKEKNKRRRARLALEVLRQQGVLSALANDLGQRELPASGAVEDKIEPRVKPFLCGLNSVTRQMECHIREGIGSGSDQTLEKIPSSPTSIKHSPTIVFVCQADVDPPALVSHFPLLSATYSAVTRPETYLIKLPAHSESKISEATGLRRCSVISVDADLLGEESDAGRSLKDLLTKIKDTNILPMRLDWLDSAIASLRGGEVAAMKLMEPRIKHMRSSALLDMNTVKATKKAGRAARKEAIKGQKASAKEGKGIKRKTGRRKV